VILCIKLFKQQFNIQTSESSAPIAKMLEK